MPYRLYTEGQTIRMDFEAIVTQEEFVELMSKVRGLESAGPVVPHRITDMTQSAGLSIRYPELFVIAAQRRAIVFPNSFKSAVVAPQPVHVGVARMWATLNDNPRITVRIFPDIDAARAWIAEP